MTRRDTSRPAAVRARSGGKLQRECLPLEDNQSSHWISDAPRSQDEKISVVVFVHDGAIPCMLL